MTNLIDKQIANFNNHFSQYLREGKSDALSEEDYQSEWMQGFFNIPGKNLFALMSEAQEGSHILLTHTVARRIAEIIEERDPEEIENYFKLRE